VPSYYIEAPAYYTTKVVEYYTEAPKCYLPELRNTTAAAQYYVAPTYYTVDGPKYHVEPKYCFEFPVYYITTYAAPSY
jgi:hypothetical protein